MSTALAIKADLLDTVPETLRRISEPAKVISFKVKITERAVEKLRGSNHLPSLPVALALARHYPEFRELLVRYMDAQTGQTEEDPMRLLHNINTQLSQLLETRAP